VGEEVSELEMADQLPPYTPPPIPKSNDYVDKDETIRQLKAQLEEERKNNQAIGTITLHHMLHKKHNLF